MTREEYMYAIGINFDNVKDVHKVADSHFMELLDRIAIAVQAFENEYLDEEEKDNGERFS